MFFIKGSTVYKAFITILAGWVSSAGFSLGWRPSYPPILLAECDLVCGAGSPAAQMQHLREAALVQSQGQSHAAQPLSQASKPLSSQALQTAFRSHRVQWVGSLITPQGYADGCKTNKN